MKYRFNLLLYCFTILAFGSFSPLLSLTITATIAKWKGNAASAYSMIHDDACGGGNYGIVENADSIAFNRGLVIGAGVIGRECVDLKLTSADPFIWIKLSRMITHGHEIINHTWQHDDMTSGNANFIRDAVTTRDTLEKNIKGCTISYFIFPYDTYNDLVLDSLKTYGYLGARAGDGKGKDRGVNTLFTNFNPFKCHFDAFSLEEDASIYAASVGRENSLKAYLDDAISKGGWALQEMHEVGTGILWGHIDIANYQKHMDYVKSKVDAGLVWNATPTAVARYIMTKDKCGAPVITDNILSFSTANAVDPRYAAGITIMLAATDPINKISANQGGVAIPVTKISGTSFMMDVDPTKGTVTLSGISAITIDALTAQIPLIVRLKNRSLSFRLPDRNWDISLYTLNGIKISELMRGCNDSSDQTVILPSAIAAGNYLLSVTAGDIHFVKRLCLVN